MLCGINQKTEGLIPEIRKDGCLFLCFAYRSPLIFAGKEGICALNFLWKKAVKEGTINAENEVVNHDNMLFLFCIEARYDGKHHQAGEKIPSSVKIVFGQYFWKVGHFVVLNKAKEVEYDPSVISNTVKNGNLKTMRYYYAD